MPHLSHGPQPSRSFQRPLRLSILLAFGLFCLAFSLQAQVMFGVVDYHSLVLAHPLMATFNPATGRFDGTTSSPVDPRTKEELATRLQDLQGQLAALDAHIRGIFQHPGTKASAEYAAYWRQRALLQDQIQLVWAAQTEVDVIGRLHEGVPAHENLMPVCQIVTRSIRGILEGLQKRYQLTGILNIGPFLVRSSPPETSVLPLNIHWKAWYGQPLQETDIRQIRLSMRQFLLNTRPRQAIFPFKAGVRNVTADALREMATLHPPAPKSQNTQIERKTP